MSRRKDYSQYSDEELVRALYEGPEKHPELDEAEREVIGNFDKVLYGSPLSEIRRRQADRRRLGLPVGFESVDLSESDW